MNKTILDIAHEIRVCVDKCNRDVTTHAQCGDGAFSLKDIVREMREFADTDSQTIGRDVLRRRIQGYADRVEAAAKRMRMLLKPCARWIHCHDIHGHMAKELLAECKEVLDDDGEFLFKEDE